MPTLYYYNNTTSSWEPAIVGETGATGAQGATGPAGSGSTGATGPAGSAGSDGSTGATGPAGSNGSVGATGASGPGFVWQGAWNPAGSYIGGQDVVSYAGSSYIKIGDGNSGSAPPDDPVRWNVMAEEGAVGAQGATGPAGTSGIDGATGATGPQGATGAFSGIVTSNLIPDVDVAYDLGNSTNRFNDIYLSNSTIYLGDATLSANGNSIVVDSITVSDGNVGTIGNIASINLDGSSSNVLYGNGVFAPGSGGGANIGNLEITGTTIGIANGATETSITVGGGAAAMTVDTDSGAPIINIYAQSTASDYYSQSGGDYATGQWAILPGGSTITLTSISPALEATLNSLSTYSTVTITINGTDTVPYNGLSLGGGTVEILTSTNPPVDPTTVNDITFNLVFNNGLYFDPDEGDMLLRFDDNVNFTSKRDINITVEDDLRLRGNDFVVLSSNDYVVIQSDYANTSKTWEFTASGNLVLASGQSVIQSIPTSSLDPTNPNVSTMVLTPDQGYNGQALVLDPTAPGHIHLRATASSNIDEPNANLYLGGENTAFEVTQGANNKAVIHSGGLAWTFSNVNIGGVGYGVINFPGESYLRSNDDTINIQSYDTANGVGRGIYVGTGGGLYFWDGNSQSVSIQQDNTEANITAIGNARITSNTYTWTFDTTGNLSLAGGGSLYGVGSTPSGAPGNTIVLQPAGSGYTTNQKLMVYPTAGDGDHIHMVTGNLYETELFLGSDDFFVKLANTGNVVVNTNDSAGNIGTWTFGTDGNLTLPGNLVIAGNTNVFGTNGSLLQTPDNLPILALSSGTNGAVSSVWLEDIGNVGSSNIAAVYANPVPGSGIVRIVTGQNGGSPYLWDFGTTGNLQVPGDVFANTGASPAPYIHGFSSLQVFDQINVGGIIITSTDGTNGQVLTTYGNGVTYWSTVSASIPFVLANANITATINTSYQILNTVGNANINFTLPDGNGLATGSFVKINPYDQSLGNFQYFVVTNGANSAGIQGLAAPLSANRPTTLVWGGAYWYYSY